MNLYVYMYIQMLLYVQNTPPNALQIHTTCIKRETDPFPGSLITQFVYSKAP